MEGAWPSNCSSEHNEHIGYTSLSEEKNKIFHISNEEQGEQGKHRGFHKAQVAVEYVMTYGWALFVLIIVLAALGVYLQNINQSYRESCMFPPQVICNNFAAVDQGEVDKLLLNLTNNFGSPVHINAVKYSSRLCNCLQTGLDIELQPGESHIFTLSSNKLRLIKGQRFNADIVLTYTTCPKADACFGPYNITGHVVAKVVTMH